MLSHDGEVKEVRGEWFFASKASLRAEREVRIER